jgi:uncharacterized protein YndB with AHSA1/START domain
MTSATPTEALLVQRILPAAPDRIFKSFTEAAKLAKWFAPMDGMKTVVHELDPRPGGRYRVDMIEPGGGAVHQLEGRYQEVDPPNHLVFTWRWLQDTDETLVRIEMKAVKQGTELLLTHEKFRTAAAKKEHADGWEGCLSRLPLALA